MSDLLTTHVAPMQVCLLMAVTTIGPSSVGAHPRQPPRPGVPQDPSTPRSLTPMEQVGHCDNQACGSQAKVGLLFV